MAGETSTATATETVATETTTENNGAETGAQKQENQNSNPMTTEAIEKIIQSRVDKATAEYGKKLALAQKENEQLKKDKMSADELAKYELDQEKKQLAAERKELVDKSNRLLAINELTKVELYDGSETATSLLNMVVNGAKEEAEITENVKAVKSVIDKLVAAQVSKTFKDNGRIPNGGKSGNSESDDKKTEFAAELGRKAAERTKAANIILDYYYNGGKK